MDAQSYLAAVRERMINGGYHATTQTLPSGAALIGYRSDFRISWAATKLHLFIAVRQIPTASREDLHAFTTEALAYGKHAKGRFRGLQVGVAAIAALVTDQADPAAAQFAQHDLTRQFSAFAWPVIIDLGREQRYAHEGQPKVGMIYNAWMREQITTILPTPTES